VIGRSRTNLGRLADALKEPHAHLRVSGMSDDEMAAAYAHRRRDIGPLGDSGSLLSGGTPMPGRPRNNMCVRA